MTLIPHFEGQRTMLNRLVAAATAVLIALAWPALSHEAANHETAALQTSHSSLPRHAPRFNRERALVGVLAYNPATEVTDYVVPYGILAESGVAEVVAVATAEGPIQMSPALRFQAETTTRQFDARFPGGADYVIVPNIYEGKDDPLVLDWLRQQARRGAVIVGICDGVPVVANAGLLEGRRATSHWRTIDGLERKHPRTSWLRNARYVVDGKIITTSGVSASIPISVALVEAIGGRAAAEKVASFLGVMDWSAAHNSEQFKLNAGSVFTVLSNKAMFWQHEALGLEVAPGVDEIRVALIADAYGRTRRSLAVSVSQSAEAVRTRRGLLLIPDRLASGRRQPDRMLPLFETLPPVQALDRALQDISASYGPATADFVALTMEYPYGKAKLRSTAP
jgi:putative intracellular protease/amidase